MNLLTLFQPKRLVFGAGCAGHCIELLAKEGRRRILLVTSSRVLTSLGNFTKGLERIAATTTVFSGVDNEPSIEIFHEALALARKTEIDAVIGVGGGSVMDVAKLVAVLVGSEQQIDDVFGIGRVDARKTFLACLPTTAGTGSEVSPNAILLDQRDNLKKGVISEHLVPDAAFIDALLTLSVPPQVTAATGLDALVHCIEAYANKFAHPIVDLYALEGIRLIGAGLLRAVRDGADVAAREQMALGSLLGGLCLGPVNTAAVHALAYPLGGEFHVAHGVSNAVLLPHVLEFNLPAAVDRYARIALALGVGGTDSPSETASRGVARLTELSIECGVPQHLSELGVPRNAIPGLARAAMTVSRLLKNNPRSLTEADAIRIYEAAY
jgi:alcohol dehydrogenase class IV